MDVPHNIQKAELDYKHENYDKPDNRTYKVSIDIVDEMIKAFSNAHRPLMIIGGGAGSKDARLQLENLLKKWNVPVVTTLRGLDIVSHREKNFIGFGGIYGNRASNFAIKYSDVILVCGARLDERFICTSDKEFINKKKVYHIDVDTVELGRIINNETKLESNLEAFLECLLERSVPILEEVHPDYAHE
ncbi:acetolactate synthase isozyme 2 large subunit [Lachnospiraceae bacterium]|nr:acetolactate synthase isozyme 2 large subunit [Lachnospiraceae bacterium]